MRISKIIVALLVSVVAVTAMTGVAVAQEDPIRISGTIYEADGATPVGADVPVNIDRYCDDGTADVWYPLINQDNGDTVFLTDANGVYSTGWVNIHSNVMGCFIDIEACRDPDDGCCQRNGTYRLNVSGINRDTKVLDDNWDELYECHWEYKPWNADIPEFATIAIPAIAVLGLFLFFNKRKQKKN